MNQVYFYAPPWKPFSSILKSLNPFMNQVYFYQFLRGRTYAKNQGRLNPFMNQVYFYITTSALPSSHIQRLNPFMNQVYFYTKGEATNELVLVSVLIPL